MGVSPLWKFLVFAVFSAVAVGASVQLEFRRAGVFAGMVTWIVWWIAANVANEVYLMRRAAPSEERQK